MPRSIVVALVSSLLLVAALASTATAPAHTASRGCGDLRVGLAYANKIRATGVSCRSGRSVAHSYTACRNHHAGRSACHRAQGYGCREGRRTYGGGEFYSNVTCRRGGRRVAFVSSRI